MRQKSNVDIVAARQRFQATRRRQDRQRIAIGLLVIAALLLAAAAL